MWRTLHRTLGFHSRLSRRTIALGSVAAAGLSVAANQKLTSKDVTEFLFQAGGHGGLMKHEQFVLKPVMKGTKGQREKQFYVDAQHNKTGLLDFLPKFGGFVMVDFQGQPKGAIMFGLA